MTGVGIWALVPVKPLAEAKTRLAQVLDPVARQRLVLAMLRHTLSVLLPLPAFAGVAVVTPDEDVARVAEETGAMVLREPGWLTGLNASLAWAASRLEGRGAKGVLVLPADLPLLQVESIEALLSPTHGAPPSEAPPRVVIAPDRRREGTNALLLVPPTAVPFCFGAGSFQRYLDAARAAGITPVVVSTPDLGADVDVPEDLAVAETLAG